MNTDKTILVVDDDEMIHRFFRLFLAREGYNIISALNHASAIESIHNHVPDLIFIDINLGDENGGMVCKELKNNLQDIPVLLISGMPLPEDECQKYKADGFITKPMDIAKLKEQIKLSLGTD